jgi:DNA-binding CsgD family transcriptional regulator
VNAAQVLPDVDPWAAGTFDHLPGPLVAAFEREDWSALGTELHKVMDGVVTDGAYGRELLALVMRLPIGIDPIFDRYRAMTSVDFGDWDALSRCLQGAPLDPIEIVGLRDMMLAPTSQTGIPPWTEMHQRMLFEMLEFWFSQSLNGYRRFMARAANYRPMELWTRADVPMNRHVRWRQLHDAFFMGVAEAVGGRLPVAVSFGVDAQRVGDAEEPLYRAAGDLVRLGGAATGDVIPDRVETWDLIASPTGPSPFACWQFTTYLLPLVAAARLPSVEWAAGVAERVAARLGSPRAQLHAEAWSLAAKQMLDRGTGIRELPSLLARARRASVGLRPLPMLVGAIASQRPEQFLETARIARHAGNVSIQVAALVWATALSPLRHEGRRLVQLLEITGWRRAVLVPPEVAAEAALGLVSLGLRGRSVIELAAVSGRPNATLEIARRHLDEPLVPRADKVQALEAIAALGTTHAHEILKRQASRKDEIGATAAALLAGPIHPLGLSERELEVLEMAGSGLTNRQIGTKLALSPHTIARHLANARGKLGARDRTEAATLLAGHREGMGDQAHRAR